MDRFVELLARTLTTRGRSLGTISAYVGWLRRFRLFVGKRLDRVTLRDVQAYQRYLANERGITYSTFNQGVCALKFFYRECLEKRWDFKKVPLQRKGRKLPEVLSREEVQALFRACANQKHRAVMMVAYGCGLRLGEVLALRPEHIDSKRMVIRVEQGKGMKDRYVMLPSHLLEVLREYWRACRPLEWLFEGEKKGRPLSPKTMQTVFQDVRRRSGITKAVSLHSLRHAFATHLLEDGANVRVIQALLGHRGLGATQVYTHLARTYVNDVVSPLDRLVQRAEEASVPPA
jgi:site-specific recombinase XerD